MADEDDPGILEFRMGDGSKWSLAGWKNVMAWLEELAVFWDWMPSYAGPDPANVRGHTSSRYQALVAEATGLREQAAAPASLRPSIDRLLMDGYAPVHPRSERGRLLAAIRQAAGDEATMFAFSMLGKVVQPNQAQSVAQLRGATLAVSPEILSLADDTAKLKAERRRYREAVQKFDAESEKVALYRDRAWETNLQELASTARHWHKRRARRWLRYAAAARGAEFEAVDSIRTVEATYKEHMGLKAPVKYWQDKAAEHADAEKWAGRWVVLFFPVALLGLAYGFVRSGTWLLQQALLPVPEGAPVFPTAIFIVASAGLASCAGLVFWVGRLLTKLYLSQHHLRQDAEERATMTETYLALIENGAASTEDRQVILNALFRNTPDGIVKEDGGLDPSIAAALGKFLAKS